MTVETECYVPVITPHFRLPHSDALETETVNDGIRDCMQILVH